MWVFLNKKLELALTTTVTKTMAKSIGAADVTLTPNKGLTGVYALCYVASLTEYTVICKETNDTFSLYAAIENPYLSFLKIN